MREDQVVLHWWSVLIVHKSGRWLAVHDLWTSPVLLLDVLLNSLLLLLELSVDLRRRG